ncbi:hypothetical protein K3495_g11615 [Podosphaera aphanis]|nr:hypothetical protein K3495_g11615 [Podosphaera aphanis]
MSIGMKFHLYAQPKPLQPSFTEVLPSRISTCPGIYNLIFYLPDSFYHKSDDFKYPVVVNFHGGGFTLGTGTDDARWATSVVRDVDAILVSVEYRLAPEYPFSVGVEDAADAVLYLAAHAEEFRIDPHRMALSGFSAGGNFVFAVPLLLKDLQNCVGKQAFSVTESSSSLADDDQHNSSSIISASRLRSMYQNSSVSSMSKLPNIESIPLGISRGIPDFTLVSLVSFYPIVDFRQSRSQKTVTNPMPKYNLPSMLTNFFDKAYIALNKTDLGDPYLSPAAASDAVLKEAYPDNIILYTCEYDMLSAEGVAFGTRLASNAIGKNVYGGLIKRVPHAFDRKPNPFKFPESAHLCYAEACAELRKIFSGNTSSFDKSILDLSDIVERFKKPEHAGGEVWSNSELQLRAVADVQNQKGEHYEKLPKAS